MALSTLTETRFAFSGILSGGVSCREKAPSLVLLLLRALLRNSGTLVVITALWF